MPLLFRVLFLAFFTLLTACGPTYPLCENDAQCAEQGEFCAAGRCAQCTNNTHCTGACVQCSAAGNCEKIFNCCSSDADCSYGKACKESTCAPQPG